MNLKSGPFGFDWSTVGHAVTVNGPCFSRSGTASARHPYRG